MAPLTTPTGQPFRLLTVNKAPERAFRLVGKVANDLQDGGVVLLEHVGNAASLEEVESKLRELRPDVLMAASMWTPAESSHAFELGRRIVGENLITHAIPEGMQVEKGPDFVVQYLKDTLPSVIRQNLDSKLADGRAGEAVEGGKL
ncbi:MAG: hypothetical protein Q9162_001606 [Coniocarpon cinnabarinum]